MDSRKMSVPHDSVAGMTDVPNPQAERARELRRAGRTLAEIKAELGLRSNSQLYAWVRDIPAPAWTRRPRAKDAERARALELRALGRTHRGIAAELGVSKASVSEWLRPPGRPRSAEALAARRRRVGIERQQEKLAAARAVGVLTDRELLLVGAVAYWAEGTKAKPWCPGEALTFTNSDPDMIRLFLRWLDLLGVDPQRLRFTVQIHESADVEEAKRFWADVVGGSSEAFRKTVLKRHTPRTNRKNTGQHYHGCLRVYVRQSAELYRRMEGTWRGLVEGSRPERRREASGATLRSANGASVWVPRVRLVPGRLIR